MVNLSVFSNNKRQPFYFWMKKFKISERNSLMLCIFMQKCSIKFIGMYTIADGQGNKSPWPRLEAQFFFKKKCITELFEWRCQNSPTNIRVSNCSHNLKSRNSLMIHSKASMLWIHLFKTLKWTQLISKYRNCCVKF